MTDETVLEFVLTAAGKQFDLKQLSGIGANVARTIALEAQLPLANVYAVYIFMKQSGGYHVTAALMTVMFGRGGCERSTKKKVPEAIVIIATRLKGPWITDKRELRGSFDTRGLWPREVQVSMDTVPIPVWGRAANLFQPKYEDHVMKLFTITTLCGFIIFVSDTVFPGPSHDGAIQLYCKVDDFLRNRQHPMVGLADCAFYASRSVIKPFTGPQIWPSRKFQDDEAIDEAIAEYYEQGEKKLIHNALVAFFRSRVEHTYSASMFNRWFIFKKFRPQLDLVYPCAVAAIVALNIETFLRHGSKGRYPALDDTRAQQVLDAVKLHRQMSLRYPRPTKEQLTDVAEADSQHGSPRHVGRPTRMEARTSQTLDNITQGWQRRLDVMFEEVARRQGAATDNPPGEQVDLSQQEQQSVEEALTFQRWVVTPDADDIQVAQVGDGTRRARAGEDDREEDDEDIQLLLSGL